MTEIMDSKDLFYLNLVLIVLVKLNG